MGVNPDGPPIIRDAPTVPSKGIRGETPRPLIKIGLLEVGHKYSIIER